jgi:hypothetical protein
MSLITLHFNRGRKSSCRLVWTRFYAMARQISPPFDASVHTERTGCGDLYQAQIWLVARPRARLAYVFLHMGGRPLKISRTCVGNRTDIS